MLPAPAGRARSSAAAMAERTSLAPREDGAPSSVRHRHARQSTRRPRSMLYIAGGLFGASGTGWWLSETRHDGFGLAGIRVPASVAIWGLVGLAGWGALLLLGELTLFVL